MKRRERWVHLVGATVSLIVALAALSLMANDAAARSVRYDEIETRIELREDGVLRITETQRVEFYEGPFTYGFREIFTNRTEGLENILVYELTDGEPLLFTEVAFSNVEDRPGQFGYVERPGLVEIGWRFDSAFSETRTFVIEYDVIGGLRHYPSADPPNQQIWWTPIGADLTRQTPVDSAVVEVVLPEPVPLDDVVVWTDDGMVADDVAERTRDGQTFTWRHGPFEPGDELVVRVQFPILIEDAVAPAWQAADDEQRARVEQSESREAFTHVLMLAVAGLLIGVGGIGAYAVWVAKGRDPHAGLVASFLPAPPDDLPPGIVGALLDEEADDVDIVATLLDLAQRGHLKMSDPSLAARRDQGADYVFEFAQLGDSRDSLQQLPAHERRMLTVLYGPEPKVGDKISLRAAIPRITSQYSQFREDLYAELVRHGYFSRSPEQTRRLWRRGAVIGGLIGAAAGLVAAALFDRWALIPMGAAVAIAIAFWSMSSRMPKKTHAGAQAAANWRAFRTYLKDIERYEKLQESESIFERYLPFAVAFGIDQKWIAKFASYPIPVPEWYGPPGRDVVVLDDPREWPRRPRAGGYRGGGIPDVDMPDFDLPDLQDTSNKAGGLLNEGSKSALLMLGKAVLHIGLAVAAGGMKGGGGGGGGGGFR